MYVDRPQPRGVTLVLPMLAALFFAVTGGVIAMLAVLVLPPTLWMFTAPVIGLCLLAIMVIGRYVSGLTRLEYRVGAGVLEIRSRDGRRWFRLDDIVEVVLADPRTAPPPPPRHGETADRSGVSSARNFANRRDGNILLNVRGEWVRLSPSDPAAFVRALGVEHGG